MGQDKGYYWAVSCKNRTYHDKKNPIAGHRIALGHTDAYSPLPGIGEGITVQCNACGARYFYTEDEVIRMHGQPPPFTPRPPFQ